MSKHTSSSARCVAILIEVSSPSGPSRRSGCRRLSIGTVDWPGAVACARWRNRRCTPEADSPPNHTGGQPDVGRPGGDASAWDQPAVRLVDLRPTAWQVLELSLPRLGLRRRPRANSCSGRTAFPSSGEVLGPQPCVAASSGAAARPTAHTRRSRAFCRSGRGRGQSPVSTARFRSRPRKGAPRRCLAFGSSDTHPSWSRVSPHSGKPVAGHGPGPRLAHARSSCSWLQRACIGAMTSSTNRRADARLSGWPKSLMKCPAPRLRTCLSRSAHSSASALVSSEGAADGDAVFDVMGCVSQGQRS